MKIAASVKQETWPLIALAYVHLRLILARGDHYYNPETTNKYDSVLAVVLQELDYPRPVNAADLLGLKNYLRELLSELEEELQ